MSGAEERARRSLAYYASKLPGEPDAYARLLAEIDAAALAGTRVLDVGCGDEFFLQYLRDRVERVIGLDVLPRESPYHEMLVGDISGSLSLADASVDLAVCKFVFEHLEHPARAVRELGRVLRTGGRVIVLTPDIRYFPYTANFFLSRVLSQGARMRVVETVTGRRETDIYPVYYRSNTPARLRALFEAGGLSTATLEVFSDFRVVAAWRLLGYLGTWYELALNRLGVRGARGFILGVFERGEEA